MFMAMLHTIRTGPDPHGGHREPTNLLLACHARLRNFSQLSLALVTRSDLQPDQVVDATHRLLRYFHVALPLHEADEEQTIAPAIAPFSSAVHVEAVDRMRSDHQTIHGVLDALFPMWDRAERDPGALDARGLEPHARRLAATLDVHLALEESTIFPLIGKIEEAPRKRMFDEMRGRRTPEVFAEMKVITGG